MPKKTKQDLLKLNAKDFMFINFTKNVLEDLYTECSLKALASEDKQKASIYEKIAEKLNKLLLRMNASNKEEG